MKIVKSTNLKAKPDFTKLGFGKYFTDHMLVMDYEDGAWKEPEIVPYAPFEMAPASNVLHYAQGIFEGAKAYKNKEGKITVFRIDDNFKRMNRSAERMCMPTFDSEKVKKALFELIKLEADWIPTEPGTALYIRPTMIANEEVLGVHASHKYRFFIILSPVGSYYANGMKPTKILVEEHYVRAPLGGTGEAKCMGNYAASLYAGEKANKLGYDQALWLDSNEHKYVEEVGSMNMFFVIGDEVVTPALVGSILPGITRNSCIQVLKKYGYKISERRISMDEIVEAYNNGQLKESFGSGTAAVISPVGVIGYKGVDMVINNAEMGPITAFLYDKITGIQNERYEDEFGWITEIK
ncbi:MAG: branched-chain amino acid aminotransferase [Eubacteriales bacterium]|nr:branched-chain amino acid aminotransferase [Clostridia bacterium]MDY4083525.1 branched-chain amino acid aminotransferase [Eubacteriales bacterium]MDY4592339.1 branched-chain amino acid aminotransferase [Eubacteriales bacterium]